MSQVNAIRRHLVAGNKISQLQALRDFGCMRLADVIWKIREQGIAVDTHWREQKGKRYAVYKLPASELERLSDAR